MDRKGLKRGIGLPAISAESSALGSPMAVLHVLVGAIDEAQAALLALIRERSEFADEARALLIRLPRHDQNDEPLSQPDR